MQLAMQTARARRNPKEILSLLRRAVEGLKLRGAPLQALVARWLCAEFDEATCRRLTPEVVSLPATPLEAYTVVLEKLAPTSGGGAAPRESRALFEAAVKDHGSHAIALWLRYSRWLSARGEFAEASAVHARALRSLAPELRAQFTEAHEQPDV